MGAGTLGSIISGLALSVLLTRSLGPTDRGVWAIALLSKFVLTMTANLGAGSAAIYFLGSGKERRSTVVYGTLQMIAGSTVVATGLGFALVAAFGTQVFDSITTTQMYLGVGSAVPSTLRFVMAQVYLGDERYLAYSVSRVLSDAAMIGVLAPMLLNGASVTDALVAHLVVHVVMAVLVVGHLLITGTGGSKPEPGYPRRAIRYSLASHVGGVAAALNLRADGFMVAGLASTSVAGVYSVASGIADYFSQTMASASKVVFAKTSSSSLDDVAVANARVLRIVVGGAGVLAAGLWVVSPVLVEAVYGADFAGASRPLRFVLPSLPLLSGSMILHASLEGWGRPDLNVRIDVTGIVLNLVANAVLIPTHGMVGAAVASSVSYGWIFGFRLVEFGRMTGMSLVSIIAPPGARRFLAR